MFGENFSLDQWNGELMESSRKKCFFFFLISQKRWTIHYSRCGQCVDRGGPVDRKAFEVVRRTKVEQLAFT